MTQPVDNGGSAAPEVLFSEPGATWRWLLAGPIGAAAMMGIQLSSGYGWSWFMPTLFFVLLVGFLGVQIKAARIHTSVELTPEYLRQGAETIRIAEIVTIYPPADGSEVPVWQAWRALGELAGVPRHRTGIGIKLSNDRGAQAWARRHRELRRVLVSVVNEPAP